MDTMSVINQQTTSSSLVKSLVFHTIELISFKTPKRNKWVSSKLQLIVWNSLRIKILQEDLSVSKEPKALYNWKTDCKMVLSLPQKFEKTKTFESSDQHKNLDFFP